MPIEVNTVQNSPSFPTQVDAVVIGAGIIGTCTAYELARKGISVALIEKGVVGGEQSSRNWGWVRQQNRDLYELPLAIYSLRRWGELSQEIGHDLGFHRTGILYCTTDHEVLARWEKWGQAAKEQGFRNEFLTAGQTKERSPGSRSAWIGGVWSPTDGRAEPSMAAPAIAEGAKALGVSLQQNCAARGLDITNKAVTGVWTERGLIKTSIVIAAGGAWTSRFCRHHDIALPAANVGGTALRTMPAPDIVGAGCLYGTGFALRRRTDGCYTLAVPGYGTLNIAPQGLRYATKFFQMYRSKVAKKLKYRIDSSFWNGPEAAGSWQNDGVSPFEKIRVLDPAPDAELVKMAIDNVVREFPALKGLEAAAAWGGAIDTTPDLLPVISPVESISGFIIASGFSGHGFGTGPGAGLLATQLALGEKPYADPRPLRLTRFSDGSAIHCPEMM